MLKLAKMFLPFVREVYATDDYIPLHAPRFTGNEKSYLLETIDSTYVSTVGEFVNRFEGAVKSYTGAAHAIATVNGTSALHTALQLVGVQPGEEVLTQSLTFVATCNAIRYVGAEPVFIDVERATLGMSPDSLELFLEQYAEQRDDGACWNKVSNRIIRACLPVHDLGHPVRIQDVSNLCQQYGIELVEDSAESLGSRYDSIHTGLFGKIGVLSFNGNKIITTGGGGMLLTNHEDVAVRAKHITTTAKKSHPWLFLHDETGYNYRMPNLNAALGCAQIENLENFVLAKRRLAETYLAWFQERDVEFIVEPSRARSNYWLNAILLASRQDRDEFLEITNQNSVMTRPLWTPMHTLDMYRDCLHADLSETKNLEDTVVCIPSSVKE